MDKFEHREGEKGYLNGSIARYAADRYSGRLGADCQPGQFLVRVFHCTGSLSLYSEYYLFDHAQ